MTSTVRILMVDDDELDVRLTRRAFAKLDGRAVFLSVHDSEELFRHLQSGAGDEATPGAAMPDVVLLDINLPRADGIDVLSRLRCEPRCGT